MPSPAMSADIEERVIAVIEDNIEAQLAIIDGVRGGDPAPRPEAYLTGPRPLIVKFPSISVYQQDWDFFEQSITDLSTGRIGYDAHTAVKMTVQQEQNWSAERMGDIADRYMGAICRILFLIHPGLDTVADPVDFAEWVIPNGVATPIDELQSSGAQVRTITIPTIVRMREPL